MCIHVCVCVCVCVCVRESRYKTGTHVQGCVFGHYMHVAVPSKERLDVISSLIKHIAQLTHPMPYTDL